MNDNLSGSVYDGIVYGIPLQVEECVAHPLPTYLISSGNAAIPCSTNIDTQNDFDDIIEILAHVDSDEESLEELPAVTASPIATARTIDGVVGYPIDFQNRGPIVTYAIPENYYFETGIEAQPFDVYEASVDEKLVHAEPACGVGLDTLDSSLLKGVEDYSQRKQKRLEAAFRMKEKRMRKISCRPMAAPANVVPSVPSSSMLFPYSSSQYSNHQAPARNVPLPVRSETSSEPVSSAKGSDKVVSQGGCNARKIATAKREREHGKFKKAKTKWVSVTELFKTHPHGNSSVPKDL